MAAARFGAASAAGLADDAVFILTSDHGSHDVKSKDGQVSSTHGSAGAMDYGDCAVCQ
ncbi:MAG TPA: hypothetical protein VHB20_02770 [Verrucomicrobiae bacterium]|nr:hypothetical protein [Verrucomicrobiae bacterium]